MTWAESPNPSAILIEFAFIFSHIILFSFRSTFSQMDLFTCTSPAYTMRYEFWHTSHGGSNTYTEINIKCPNGGFLYLSVLSVTLNLEFWLEFLHSPFKLQAHLKQCPPNMKAAIYPHLWHKETRWLLICPTLSLTWSQIEICVPQMKLAQHASRPKIERGWRSLITITFIRFKFIACYRPWYSQLKDTNWIPRWQKKILLL